jgi:hypothetical protein
LVHQRAVSLQAIFAAFCWCSLLYSYALTSFPLGSMRFWKQKKRAKPINKQPQQKRAQTPANSNATKNNNTSKSSPGEVKQESTKPTVIAKAAPAIDTRAQSVAASVLKPNIVAGIVPLNIIVPPSTYSLSPYVAKPDSIPVQIAYIPFRAQSDYPN